MSSVSKQNHLFCRHVINELVALAGELKIEKLINPAGYMRYVIQPWCMHCRTMTYARTVVLKLMLIGSLVAAVGACKPNV